MSLTVIPEGAPSTSAGSRPELVRVMGRWALTALVINSTPHVSIVVWAVLVFTLALTGGFLWNAVLSVASRLITYALMCAALIQLRRQSPAADAWRARWGRTLAVLGLLFCLVLGRTFEMDHLLIIAAVGGVAALNWVVVRKRPLIPS